MKHQRSETLGGAWNIRRLPWRKGRFPHAFAPERDHANEQFNTAVRDGSIGETLDRILKETKPETVYFTERNGHRGAILIFDLADPSKIPAVAEPWFLAFNADFECRIAMTPEDLKKAGLGDVGKK